jgi:hypothetical protein
MFLLLDGYMHRCYVEAGCILNFSVKEKYTEVPGSVYASAAADSIDVGLI